MTSILLVDDDLMVRQALEQALATENYFVVAAANREEALRQLGRHRIDILLVDVHPWSEDGWETVQRLTALQPSLPVVAMTARIEQLDSNHYSFDALLEKPLNLAVLMQTLKGLASLNSEPRRQALTPCS